MERWRVTHGIVLRLVTNVILSVEYLKTVGFYAANQLVKQRLDQSAQTEVGLGTENIYIDSYLPLTWLFILYWFQELQVQNGHY